MLKLVSRSMFLVYLSSCGPEDSIPEYGVLYLCSLPQCVANSPPFLDIIGCVTGTCLVLPINSYCCFFLATWYLLRFLSNTCIVLVEATVDLLLSDPRRNDLTFELKILIFCWCFEGFNPTDLFDDCKGLLCFRISSSVFVIMQIITAKAEKSNSRGDRVWTRCSDTSSW